MAEKDGVDLPLPCVPAVHALDLRDYPEAQKALWSPWRDVRVREEPGPLGYRHPKVEQDPSVLVFDEYLVPADLADPAEDRDAPHGPTNARKYLSGPREPWLQWTHGLPPPPGAAGIAVRPV